jgi:iron complex transport system ATP-binding protein
MSARNGDQRQRPQLRAAGLALGYGAEDVVADVDLVIPDGKITVVIGANACGKSTLLRGLARVLKPARGAVYLDGKSIHQRRTIDVARELGLLAQSPVAPDGITVADLVGRGRYPHQGWLRQSSADDDRAVGAALAATGIVELAGRRVQELSGGQRQRAWLAMALAQETELMLLDEPTSFLDINHEIELLDLLTDLNREASKTIVLVLHDLNLACRYADHIVAMRMGQIFTEGRPEEVIDAATIAAVFGLDCEVIPSPVSGTPLVVPRGRHDAGANGTAPTAPEREAAR